MKARISENPMKLIKIAAEPEMIDRAAIPRAPVAYYIAAAISEAVP